MGDVLQEEKVLVERESRVLVEFSEALEWIWPPLELHEGQQMRPVHTVAHRLLQMPPMYLMELTNLLQICNILPNLCINK